LRYAAGRSGQTGGKRTLLAALRGAVVDMDAVLARELASEVVTQGMSISEAIERSLAAGMRCAGDLYEAEKYFIPDLLMCADAMDAAMSVFSPHLPAAEKKTKGRVVIGTIQGDTHDIGKNIVALMLGSSGYDVLDLGRDVPPKAFVESAVRHRADIIAVSALLTTTMGRMADVVRELETQELRNGFLVMVGGKPVSAEFTVGIGADLYAKNAAEALRVADRAMKKRKAENGCEK
jgi:Predicted cobalamin binding protein